MMVAAVLAAPCLAGETVQNGPPAASPHGHSPAEFEHMADDLKRSLAARPGDADNWILLGRTDASLNRWSDAKDAFAHAIALRPGDPALHAQLGEVLVLEASGNVSPAARAEFAGAADDPRSRFYLAVALAQSGDTAQAVKKLQDLAAEAPPQAAWRQLVVDEVQTLQSGTAAAAPAPAPVAPAGPDHLGDQLQAELATLATPQTPAPPPAPALPAAADLEARLKQHPDDQAGWLALGRAYRAHGQTAQALDALRRANQAIPANRDLLLAYADALADGIKSDALPDDFVGVMRQVNAIDPDQVDALWYLGLAAAQHGDTHRAVAFWRRLAADLPAGSKDRKTVQERLDALP